MATMWVVPRWEIPTELRQLSNLVTVEGTANANPVMAERLGIGTRITWLSLGDIEEAHPEYRLLAFYGGPYGDPTHLILITTDTERSIRPENMVYATR